MNADRRLELLPFALGVAAGAALLSLVEPHGGRLVSALPLDVLPAAGFGVAPSRRAVEAAALQRSALDGLSTMVAWLGALTLLLAVGAAAILLSVRGSLRAHGVAVRAALGAPLRGQLRRLVRLDAGPILVRGAPWAAAGAVVGAVLLRLTWPGGGLWGVTGPSAALLAGAVLVGAALVVAAALLPLRYVRGDLGRILGSGERVGRGYLEGGMRRVLTVVQLAASLALLSGAVVLATRGAEGAAPGSGGPPGDRTSATAPAAPGETLLLPLAIDGAADEGARRGAWEALAERVRRLPTVRAESIATPGAWSGLGRRDFALADCGACVRGGLWVPFLGEDALHHAVSPRFFESAGLRVVDGRGLTAGDGPDAPRVAVVNRAFAESSFERGRPVGRRLRVGDGDTWYTVVGVVEEPRRAALGRAAEPEPAVWLSALQHPPDRAVLSLVPAAPGGAAFPQTLRETRPQPLTATVPQTLPGEGAALETLLSGLPLALAGPPVTVAELRARDAAPLRWVGRVSAVAGLVTVLVALLGVRAVSRIEVVARRRELGVRLALGATPRRVRRHVVGRSVRAALLASLLGIPGAVAVTARAAEMAGDVPLFQPGPYLALAGLVVLAAASGAWGPSAVAERTEPAVVLADR